MVDRVDPTAPPAPEQAAAVDPGADVAARERALLDSISVSAVANMVPILTNAMRTPTDQDQEMRRLLTEDGDIRELRTGVLNDVAEIRKRFRKLLSKMSPKKKEELLPLMQAVIQSAGTSAPSASAPQNSTPNTATAHAPDTGTTHTPASGSHPTQTTTTVTTHGQPPNQTRVTTTESISAHGEPNEHGQGHGGGESGHGKIPWYRGGQWWKNFMTRQRFKYVTRQTPAANEGETHSDDEGHDTNHEDDEPVLMTPAMKKKRGMGGRSRVIPLIAPAGRTATVRNSRPNEVTVKTNELTKEDRKFPMFMKWLIDRVNYRSEKYLLRRR